MYQRGARSAPYKASGSAQGVPTPAAEDCRANCGWGDSVTGQPENSEAASCDLGELVAEFRGRLVRFAIPCLVFGVVVGFIIGHGGALGEVIAGLIVGVAVSVGLFLLYFRAWRKLSVKVYSGGLVYRTIRGTDLWNWSEVKEFLIRPERREIHGVPHGLAEATLEPILDALVGVLLPKGARYKVWYELRQPGRKRTFDATIRGHARLSEMIQKFVTECQLPVAQASFRSGDVVPFGKLLLGQDGLVVASAKHPRFLPLTELAGISASRYDVKVHQVGRKLAWLSVERSAVPNAAVLAELAKRILGDRDLQGGDESDARLKPGRPPDA